MTEVGEKGGLQTLFVLLEGDEFRFSCHRGLECFTACCAKLRLILTPYDILRLKNNQGIPSDRFLDLYTDTVFDEGRIFPLVRLKMALDEGGKCPFLRPEGCSVYEDRPGACRLYPVGRASAHVGGTAGVREKFFLVREPHCKGFYENRIWTLDEWTSHEGLSRYESLNDRWLAIVTCRDSLGTAEQAEKKSRMFFMASYNLDKFRAFLFSSRFFELFKVDNALRDKIEKDDEALLEFAFDWLEFSLFGKKTLSVLVDL